MTSALMQAFASMSTAQQARVIVTVRTGRPWSVPPVMAEGREEPVKPGERARPVMPAGREALVKPGERARPAMPAGREASVKPGERAGPAMPVGRKAPVKPGEQAGPAIPGEPRHVMLVE